MVAGGEDFVFVIGGCVRHNLREVREVKEGLARGVELEFLAFEREALADERQGLGVEIEVAELDLLAR